MLKKVIAVIFVLLLALGVVAKPAQAAVPVNYESSIQIRNLTETPGTINLTFYDLSGIVVGTPLSDEIAANETKSYYQSTMPVSAGFNGSVVVSSDVQIGAVSDLVGLDAKAKPISYAAYSGFVQGTLKVYLPALFKNNWGYDSFYYVQNTGDKETTVTIEYSDGTSGSISSLAPGQSAIVDQKSETHAPKVFSAILTSTVAPIAATVVEAGPALSAYSGFGAGSIDPLMPLINQNNYGFFTGVQIMNIGDTETVVTVDYTPSMAGTACFETRTISPGASETFSQYVFYETRTETDSAFTTDCVMGKTFIGSAKVTDNTAGEPLVATVNQLQLPQGRFGSYSAFDPSEAGTKVIYPLLMDRNWGHFSSFSLINVGTTEIPVGGLSCLFTGTANSGPVSKTISNPVAMSANESWTLNHNGLIGDGFVGGATCVGPAGSLLVGTSNQLGDGSRWVGVDSFLVSEGFIIK